MGSPQAFVVACVLVIVWFATGPWFQFSDTWQLVINTITDIVIFLMVFLIQNTQNRRARVMQLQLDELIRAVRAARTSLVSLEDLSDAELHLLQEQFQRLRKKHDGEELRLAPDDVDPTCPE